MSNPLPAAAVEPVGACCLDGGVCEQRIEIACVDVGGDFIGVGTDCAEIDCAAPVAAPALSILGLVALAGALTALGGFRLFTRRQRRAGRA